jgi:cytochrome c-type biogenesis protein CcmH
MVSAEARAAFERALALEPGNPRSRFYLALAAAQDGDRDRARAGFEALLKEFPADAPFVPRLREEIARLGGAPEAPPAGEAPAASEFRPSGEAAAAIAGLPPPERMAAIRSMVEGLAARLEAGGGGVEEWTRLIRSYAALGERDKAAAALASARERLGGDKASLDRIEELAQGLRIPQDAPRP